MNVDFLKYKYEDGYDGVITKKRFGIGVRHIQMLYMLVCTTAFGVLRGCSSISILALTDVSRQNDTYIQIQEWDNRIQGITLSAYFFGYAFMIIPAELLLKEVSGKITLATILVLEGALYVAMPTVINKGGWMALCNSYFLLGMMQACLSPANLALLSRWLPPSEKTLFSGLIYGGLQLGIMIGMVISGIISKMRLGWELIFYSQGVLTLSLAVIWALLTSDSAENHQAVGDTEKEYIAEALSFYRKRVTRKPWRSIIKSRQFWAIASAHSASNVIFIFYLADVPIYLKSLGETVKESAWISALPFASMWMTYLMTAPSIDWIYKIACINNLKYVTYYRKSINAIGAFGTIVGLTTLSTLGHDSSHLTIIIVLIATLGLLGFQFSGFLENHTDITYNYSGTLLFMTSTVASVAGALVPLVTGLILDDVMSIKRWRIIFLTLAVIYTLCNVVYTVYGSSELQFWDNTMKSRRGYHNGIIDQNQVELDELAHSKHASQKVELDTAM